MFQEDRACMKCAFNYKGWGVGHLLQDPHVISGPKVLKIHNWDQNNGGRTVEFDLNVTSDTLAGSSGDDINC